MGFRVAFLLVFLFVTLTAARNLLSFTGEPSFVFTVVL